MENGSGEAIPRLGRGGPRVALFGMDKQGFRPAALKAWESLFNTAR